MTPVRADLHNPRILSRLTIADGTALLLMLLALVALTPFLGVELPSMTDLPGHIGRYHVMMNIEASEHLRRFYAFE
jgi:hypothetical protein